MKKESKKFKVIIVEDVKLELKGTEEIFRHEIFKNMEVFYIDAPCVLVRFQP